MSQADRNFEGRSSSKGIALRNPETQSNRGRSPDPELASETVRRTIHARGTLLVTSLFHLLEDPRRQAIAITKF